MKDENLFKLVNDGSLFKVVNDGNLFKFMKNGHYLQWIFEVREKISDRNPFEVSKNMIFKVSEIFQGNCWWKMEILWG